MNETQKTLVLKDGKKQTLANGDDLEGIDFHSGLRLINSGEFRVLKQAKEMRVRRILRVFGTLKTEGLLIMD